MVDLGGSIVGDALHVDGDVDIDMTGSGITLDALVREAAAAGWDQCAVVGTPSSVSVNNDTVTPPRGTSVRVIITPEKMRSAADQ